MKTVTYEQFIEFHPCWLNTPNGVERLRKYGKQKAEWTALDVLNLEEVSAEDRLWAVLREEFIDAPVLHEFACRCAERALSSISNPDPRSLAAIDAKRKWLKGEITLSDLRDARDDAIYAMYAAICASRFAAICASRSAVYAAGCNVRYDAMYAAREDVRSAMYAAREDVRSAMYVYEYDARLLQFECLRELLEEGEK